MISGIDVNSGEKIPSSAFVHTLYERLGMGTDLSAGDAENVTQAVNSLYSNLIIVDYASSINIVSLKTWTESSFTIPAAPSGFNFDNIISMYAFASDDSYGTRWLRLTANQTSKYSSIIGLIGYALNTTGTIPITIRVCYKKWSF